MVHYIICKDRELPEALHGCLAITAGNTMSAQLASCHAFSEYLRAACQSKSTWLDLMMRVHHGHETAVLAHCT
jgi:hypothetical protein